MKDGYSLCMNEWALDKDIQNELGLLLIISSLCAEKGYCFANNEYLASVFNTNATLISRKIKKLEDKGYLVIEYKKRGCEIISREIRLSKSIIHDYLNRQSTIIEIDKENIINNNNTKNNISNDILQKGKVDFDNNCKEIIDHLNTRLGSSYKYSTKKTCDLIKARFKEGFTLEDFKTVIDKMCIEWINTDMQKYLRPETLFGTKFESYLNREVKQRINNLHLSSEDINEIFNFN